MNAPGPAGANSGCVAGARDPQKFELYAQWKAMSEYIRAYIGAHSLSDQTRNSLLSFNAQYLVRIADYSQIFAKAQDVDMSPLAKNEMSYHRDYARDNRLLHEGIQGLKQMWPDASIFLAGNRSYLNFLRNIRRILKIDWDDSEEIIKRKVEKYLALYESDPQACEKYPFYVHLTAFSIQVQRYDVISKIGLVDSVIRNYPFSDKGKAELIRRITIWGVSYEFYANIRVLVVNDDTQQFRSAVSKGGSTPTLQQTSEFYATMLSQSDFYKQSIGNSPIQLQPAAFGSSNYSLEELKKGALVLLKKLDMSKEPSHVRIVGKGVVAIVEVLFQLDLSAKFKEMGLEDLLSASAARINLYLEQFYEQRATSNYGTYVDLITEEISLLLMLGLPYKEGELQEIIRKKAVMPWPEPQYVRMTQSASQGFNEIVHALMKTNKADGQAPSFMYFDDIYFECNAYLKHCLQFRKGSAYGVTTADPQSFSAQIQKLKNSGQTLSGLFIDLHSSAQAGRGVQTKHDVSQVIEDLKSHGVLGPSVVICIDNTIGTWGTEEIQAILTKYDADIKSGRFHFVIYRSLHKLDIFGSDKFMAGLTIAYSAPGSTFLKMLNKETSTVPVDGLDYQAYCHFFKWAMPFIQEYFQKIVENGNYLYQLLDPALIYPVAKMSDPFWISQKLDDKSTYIEMGFADEKSSNEIYKKIIDSYQLVNRDSFGYRETSILKFKSDNLVAVRITPGIEEKSVIARQAQLLNTILKM